VVFAEIVSNVHRKVNKDTVPALCMVEYNEIDVKDVQTVYIAQVMPEEPDPQNPAKIYTEKIGTSKSAAKQKALETVDQFDLVSKVTLHNLVWDQDQITMDGVTFNIKEKTLCE